MNLKNKTRQLKQELDLLRDNYEKNEPPANRSDHNFFDMVRERTAPIYDLVAKWEEETLQRLKARELQMVHPQQIISTRENMELLLMHSYFIDVKRKRYMELNHSVHFIFDRLLEELNS